MKAGSRWPAYAFFAALAAAGPLLDPFWHSLLTLVFFYAFLGLAWNLMMGVAGLLSLGHALYLGIGAYATAVLSQRYGITPWLGIPAGAAIAAAAGAVTTWLGSRFAVRGVYFALLTIAFAELLRVVFDNWGFVGATGGFFLKAVDPATNVPLVSLRGNALFFYCAFLVLMVAGYLLVERLLASRWGYWWRSIRDDEEAARALGVPALRCKVAVVAISAAMTAAAGGLFGLLQGSLFPDSVMGMRMSIELLIAPIIGGLGTPFGPIVGAIFVVPMMELSNSLGQSTGIYGVNTLIYGLVVLAVITFMPEGLWPQVKRWFGPGEARRARGA
ncbi:MAG: branched-chain amino acid ABC transporter permease [Rhodospirillaceae bacterium]|nr:branched-chain amino acid ABC transporter permease [Rhodospirillaceae bacterium]